MKIQDIVFFFFLSFLLYKYNPYWLVIAAVACLFLSIPLFSFWVFFTAERLVWYAAGFFLTAIILNIIKLRLSND